MIAKLEFLMRKWMCHRLAVGAAAALVGGASLLATRPAAAAVQDVFTYTTDQANYDASPGQTITVKIYLKDNLASGTRFLAQSVQNGLLSAGVSVSQVVAGAPANPTTLSGLTMDTGEFAGPSFVGSNTATSIKFIENIAAGSTVPGVQLGNTGGGASPNTPVDSVYLGSVTLTAGSSAGKTTFTLGQNGANTLSRLDFDDLDSTGAGTDSASVGYTPTSAQVPAPSFTVNVTATPEPSSLGALVGVAGAALARRSRRRR